MDSPLKSMSLREDAILKSLGCQTAPRTGRQVALSEDNLKIAGKKADSRGSSTEEQVMCTVSNHVSRCLLSDPTASASGNRSELKAEFG